MNRKLYAIMTGGAVIGVIAAFLQTLEKLQLIANKDAVLPCNLNSVFSCSTVLNAPQSSLLGFPNSILCLFLFTTFLCMAIVGLVGGTLPKRLQQTMAGISLFTLGFAIWFLLESTFGIGALCIFCIFCFIGLLMINGAWLRLLFSGTRNKQLKKIISGNYDALIWASIAVLMALVMYIRFH